MELGPFLEGFTLDWTLIPKYSIWGSYRRCAILHQFCFLDIWRDGFLVLKSASRNPYFFAHTAHTCPFGEPVIDVHGNTLRCYELSRTETPYKTSINGSKQLLSKCPDGYFCTVKDEEMRKTFKVGHCCQKPKPYCPYGEPLTDGPCQESCPQHTHYCHRYDTPFMEVCCPRQCSGTQQFIAGRCRSASLPLGAPCDYNEQCGNGFPEGFCVNGMFSNSAKSAAWGRSFFFRSMCMRSRFRHEKHNSHPR